MSTPKDKKALFRTALAGAETDDDRADVWQSYYQGNTDHIDGELEEARRILREGTPAELIEFVGKDVTAQAVEAARHFQDPENRYRLDT